MKSLLHSNPMYNDSLPNPYLTDSVLLYVNPKMEKAWMGSDLDWLEIILSDDVGSFLIRTLKKVKL